VSELPEQVEESIRTRRLFRPGQRILVAVSGGVDSMVLLHVLHGLAPKHGWRLSVAHLNHQLRGRSSDADERLVRRTARTLKVRLVVARADVRGLARARRLSLEMAAREARHGFLARVARRGRISSIALAHHADDQLELFFLRLLRGSGGEGLAGMKWRNASPSDEAVEVVHPLLGQSKAALLEYAAEQGIRYREDASNALLDFQRNRIRHELLPLLRAKYQPALDRTIPRVMDIVGAEAQLAQDAARQWLERMGIPKPKCQSLKARSADIPVGIRKREHQGYRDVGAPGGSGGEAGLAFEKLPVAVQRRCVQLQLLTLGVVADFELVEQLRRAPGRAVTVGPLGVGETEGKDKAQHGARAGRVWRGVQKGKGRGTAQTPVVSWAIREPSGHVRLQQAREAAFATAEADLALTGRAGEVEFDGVAVRWRVRSRGGLATPTGKGGWECFDADKVGSRIRLRHWRPGDRFQPIGMGFPVKLQDFFTNQKVPRDQRRRLIVATTDKGEVFWVEGLRIADRFKLTKDTIRCLQWRWQRL